MSRFKTSFFYKHRDPEGRYVKIIYVFLYEGVAKVRQNCKFRLNKEL